MSTLEVSPFHATGGIHLLNNWRKGNIYNS